LRAVSLPACSKAFIETAPEEASTLLEAVLTVFTLISAPTLSLFIIEDIEPTVNTAAVAIAYNIFLDNLKAIPPK
jgi:hypothetical protein